MWYVTYSESLLYDDEKGREGSIVDRLASHIYESLYSSCLSSFLSSVIIIIIIIIITNEGKSTAAPLAT